MKKYLSIVLSIIIVLSSVSFCFAATGTTATATTAVATTALISSGTYSGTGSDVTINCGFKPKIVFIQCIDPATGTKHLAGFTCDPNGDSSIGFLGSATWIEFPEIQISTTGFDTYGSEFSISGSTYSWVAIG